MIINKKQNVLIINKMEHIVLIAFLLIVTWLYYRFKLHPNYRWRQKGNVCYENSYVYSILVTTIIYALIQIITII